MAHKMDRLLFGDNQFFGINHMSEEKARAGAMRFQKTQAIVDVLDVALAEGVRTFMCTTHDRILEIAQIMKANPAKYADFIFYPGMPYAHKYANAVTEDGYLGTLKRFLPQEGLLDAAVRGGLSIANKDVEGLITLLVDAEMKMFEGVNAPVIFLQNVVVDLLLGLKFKDAFRIFADHVRKRYNAEPGYITMNLPLLLRALEEQSVENPIVCANMNKIGFRMSGGWAAYAAAIDAYPCRVIAMSIYASGAIPPAEAIAWVAEQPQIESMVFGASGRANIRNTVELVKAADARRAIAA